MGKLKIKKQKIQKNSIPAPLNVTNFTMEQISRQTGVRIESLKTYLNAREQEIKEQLIKESQEKLWKAEDGNGGIKTLSVLRKRDRYREKCIHSRKRLGTVFL